MPAATAIPRPHPLHNPWLIAVIVSIATFMEVLDTSIASVSLRHIAGNLAAGEDESTWVITSYLVANAVVLPISGWLATFFGRKRFYMLCVAGFTIASLLCGMAPTIGWLVFFRIMQGLAGGGLAPCEQAILTDTFPPAKRPLAFAVYGIAVVVAPAVGPVLGGWITDTFSWRWCFLINVPVGIGSLILSSIFVQDPASQIEQRRLAHRRKFDFVGFGLVALGLACLEVTLSRGERYDWFSSSFITTFAVTAGAALTLAVAWAINHKNPAFDVGLLANRSFAVSMLGMFATGFILFASTTYLPMLMQSYHGYNATLAGIAITGGGIATFLVMPLAGALVRIVQPRYLIMLGLLIQAVSLWHMSRFSADVPFWHVVWARVYQAVGLPLLMVPILTVSSAGIPPERSNNASAMLNLFRMLGGDIGIATVETFSAHRSQHHHATLVQNLSDYNPAFNGALHSASGLAGGAPQGLAALYGQVVRQAGLLAYDDVFLMVGVGALVLIPTCFLLARVKPGAQVSMH